MAEWFNSVFGLPFCPVFGDDALPGIGEGEGPPAVEVHPVGGDHQLGVHQVHRQTAVADRWELWELPSSRISSEDLHLAIRSHQQRHAELTFEVFRPERLEGAVDAGDDRREVGGEASGAVEAVLSTCRG